MSRPALRGLADPRPPVGPGDAGRSTPAAAAPWYGPAVWRSDDLGATWTHSTEGLTYGDDGAEDPDGLERDAGPRHRSTRASSRPACSGATTAARPGARRGPARPPEPRPELAAGRRRPDPPLDRPPPDRRRPDVGRHLGRRRRSRRRTAATTWEPRNKRRPRRLQPRTRTRDRPVRPQARDGGRRAGDASTSRTTAACTAPTDGGESGPRSRRACRPSSASRWSPIRATRDTAG